MAIVISPQIRGKLATKHQVKPQEVDQCFANRQGEYILDTREEHVADALTYWFIAETDYGRKLKVVFVEENGNLYIRTAFPPNEATIRYYLEHGGSAI